jgi:hypothetical protein
MWIYSGRCEEACTVGSPTFNKEKLVECVLIIHAVQDYASWKFVFDRAAAIRKAVVEAPEFIYLQQLEAGVL